MNNSMSSDKKNKMAIIIGASCLGILVIGVLGYFAISEYNSYNSAKKGFFDMFGIAKKKIKDANNSSVGEASEGIKTIRDKMKAMEEDSAIEEFNDDLDVSETDFDGSKVKNVIAAVVKSNSKNADHLVKVNYSGSILSTTQELNDLITKIDTSRKYTITKEYDSNGYINLINIL